jgi:hypothetical protein
MNPFRSCTQVGLLLGIVTCTILPAAQSEETRPSRGLLRLAAVTPDVLFDEASDSKTGIVQAADVELRPEPEVSLPISSALPPTGDSTTTKPVEPMDIDSQFQQPVEVRQQPLATNARKVESRPTTTSVVADPSQQTAPPSIAGQAKDVNLLLALANEAIQISSRRYLTADGDRPHTPWQIIHGLLAYRQDFELKTHDGRKINALEWVSSGVSFRGESLFQRTPYGGRAHPFIQPYWFEGHPTQFMAYLTMCRLPLTHEFKTANKEIVTVADIINNAKMEVTRAPDVEMTWTLWALAHYLEPTAQWYNKHREPWSMEELVRHELKNTIYDGPCGGTHSLFATAYARNAYLQSKLPLRGVWLEADQKIQRFIAEAKALQNSDGSFSIHFFKGPGYSQDFNTRITSSGHMIEWLMVALPQSRLSEPWIQQGVRRLAQDLIDNRHVNAECGPLYHAINGLQIYRERMEIAAQLARRNAEGWKAAPSQPKPSLPALNNNVTEPAISAKAPTTIVIGPKAQLGEEIVVPKRRPAAIAEQPSNRVRQQ